MAAMLLSRARQAISEPEVWPSLLDDAELKEAYAAYKRNETFFDRSGGAIGMTLGAPAVAKRLFSSNPRLPQWARDLSRGLEMFKARIMRQLPPSFRSIKIPDVGFNRGKPFKVSGPAVLIAYIGWILSSGALQSKAKVDAFGAEAARRGIALE